MVRAGSAGRSKEVPMSSRTRAPWVALVLAAAGCGAPDAPGAVLSSTARLGSPAIAGQLHAAPVERAPFGDAPAALAAALSHHAGVAVAPSSVVDLGAQGDWRRLALAGAPLALTEPARAKPVYFATPERLVPAHA